MKKITLLVAFLLFPGLSQAAVDMFLDIEGVAGESVDKVHGDEIARIHHRFLLRL